MLDTDLFMACLDLRNRRALVVGTGPLALEKVRALTASGAAVTVVTTDPDDELAALGRDGAIDLRREDYGAEHLEGCLLVIAATTDDDLNRRVFHDAEARTMLVNVVDVPDLCNFIFPAIARRGPLAVAITTSGASPALAQRMRRETAERFDEAYARLARLLDAERPWAKEHLTDYESRRDFFASIVNGQPDPIELLRSGEEDAVTELIRAAKERAS